MLSRSLVAIGQMTSTNVLAENLKTCAQLASQAASKGANMLFLPECCAFIGKEPGDARSAGAVQSVDGEICSQFKAMAKENNLWLSIGGFAEQDPCSPTKGYNTHLIINNQGIITDSYRKTHLFEVEIPGGPSLHESRYANAGSVIGPPASTPFGKIGLLICYDLRFPDASNRLRDQGADIITYPAAFTSKTGEAHWEVLLRARAIETQCYVIAAAQTGKHNEKRSSYGHAMVVDPWGTIVAQCNEGTGIAVAELDPEKLLSVRRNMPVWDHRRKDLYNASL